MNINEKHFSIGDITIINDDCLKYLETLEDNSVTIRDRDTMEQKRIKIEEVTDYFNENIL